MDGRTVWQACREPELPEGLPKPEPMARGPNGRVKPAELAWFHSPDADELEDVYVCRAGDGGPLLFKLFVYTVPRTAPAPTPWPTLPALWELAAALCLPGALFQFPVFVAGMDAPDFGHGSLVTLEQVAALKDTPAGKRLELSGAGLSLDALTQGAPGGGFGA